MFLQKASCGYPLGISPISEVYVDEGLVGVYIVSEADHIGRLCDAAIKALKSFAIDDSAFQAAKLIFSSHFCTLVKLSLYFRDGISSISRKCFNLIVGYLGI